MLLQEWVEKDKWEKTAHFRKHNSFYCMIFQDKNHLVIVVAN